MTRALVDVCDCWPVATSHMSHEKCWENWVKTIQQAVLCSAAAQVGWPPADSATRWLNIKLGVQVFLNLGRWGWDPGFLLLPRGGYEDMGFVRKYAGCSLMFVLWLNVWHAFHLHLCTFADIIRYSYHVADSWQYKIIQDLSLMADRGFECAVLH